MIQQKILLVSHDASRTGAPILLLNLSDVLSRAGYTVHFLLKYGGPLLEEFKRRGRSIVATQFPMDIRSRIKRKLHPVPQFYLDELSFPEYACILSNTITNGDLLPTLRARYNGLIISYVHELKMATDLFTSPDRVHALISVTDKFAVPSRSVREHLIGNLGIPNALISPLNYYIPVSSVQKAQLTKDRMDTFLVGGLGTADWRKSPDLFIHTAVELFKDHPETSIKFLWQGAEIGDLNHKRLEYDLAHAGLGDKVCFAAASDNVSSFYGSIDLFLLTSREDPFPLVVLEAAGNEIPAVCFDHSGGACEFVRDGGGGTVVPYLDTEKMASSIWNYYEDRNLLSEHGRLAKKHLVENYQNEALTIRQLEHIINGKT